MTINVMESKLAGKGKPEKCEDGIVVTNHYVAVVDGSTGKTSYRHFHGASNGRMAMLMITSFIETHASPDMTLSEFCHALTLYIRQVYRITDVMAQMKAHPEDRLTASVALYSCKHNSVWLIGDCQAIVDGQYYSNSKPSEYMIAQKRVQLIRQGLSPVEARRQIEPLLVKCMREEQNISYPVVDGFPVYLDGVLSIPVKNSVVLATDGYPFLRNTLAESEILLHKQLTEDPQNICSFIATKGRVDGNSSFDDRAYIRFSVDGGEQNVV